MSSPIETIARVRSGPSQSWVQLMQSRRTGTVVALGIAQTLAFASTFYLPAILAAPMARDLGVSVPTVFAAFSAALVISAFVGPRAGAAIDRLGGRPVLMLTSILFALGLASLGLAQGEMGLFGAWMVLGLGMGIGLYEAAFAALVRLYGKDARSSITGITLIAGFASTVGWPLSTMLEAQAGWRGTCFAWAAMHLVLGLPLNALLPGASKSPPAVSDETASGAPLAVPTAGPASRLPMVLLSFAFAAAWFISTAMAAHLPRLMVAAGTTAATAILVGSLIGPAQVAARLLEFGVLRRVHPLLSARVATLGHPLGVALILVAGPVAAPVFAVLHGAGNGLLTIARGTLPLAVFGPQGYGQRQGRLMVPARVAQALAPWLFGMALDTWGSAALALSAGLGAAAFLALLAVHDKA
jgi:predicted MFS family arabinose efflux permease